jgi:ribonuclease HII
LCRIFVYYVKKGVLEPMTRVAGLDEAGRGCVIGPLVVAGVVFHKESIEKLRDYGVKDSKLLNRKKREGLESIIKELSLSYKYFEISPKTIDKVVLKNRPLRKLNYLETMVMAKLIRDLRPDEAYVDPTDVNFERCAKQIISVIPFDVKIICEPKADLKFVVTAAASILAKTRRDKIISELREKYGDFGSGYPSDKKTRCFIKSWFSEHDECPSFMRESWITVQRARKELTQQIL